MNIRLARLILGIALALPTSAWAQAEAARAEAYELLKKGELAEAAGQFERYLAGNPDDLQAALDYAEVLSRLERHEQVVVWLEQVHQRYPNQEPAYFRLGSEYVRLKRYADAEEVFNALQQSANKTLAEAAAEASRRLQSDRDQEEKLQAETRVFDLAAQGQYEAVLTAVDDLEKRWALALPVAMQRLYALYNLQRFETALTLAQALAARHAESAELAFLRAELFVETRRPEEAVALWQEVENRHPGTPLAAEARRRRLAHQPPPPPKSQRAPSPPLTAEEDRIFALAQQEKNRKVVEAIDALEKETGKVSWLMEMQRLYALYNLRQYAQALDRAETMSQTQPEDVNLAFLRAELFVQMNRPEEAVALWRQIEQAHPDTYDAREAAKRRQAQESAPTATPYRPTEEDKVFALAESGRHREVIDTVDAMEKQSGRLSWLMELQRLYAMQAVGDRQRARQHADHLAVSHPDDPHLALIRADLLLQTGDAKEAGILLDQLRQQHPGEPVEREAQRRLQSIPPIVRPDKSYWGEAYFSGDYFGRFGAVLGSGLARHGLFIPQARWLQPYAEFRFGVDTESGLAPERTVIIDNQVGFYGGVRAQLLPTEYLFVYGQGGANKDLLDNREEGNWAYDYQAGTYGFKSWGPGRFLMEAGPATTGARPRNPSSQAAPRTGRLLRDEFFWRGDWLVDGGADFSYYHRYASWIGYGQAHEGFRLFQIGPHLALDTYLVENLSWDIKGNYFDNLVEVGPGARWLWKPCLFTDVILRAEWLNGYYLGRDDLDRRGGASGQYDEVRVGLSVGLRW